MICEKCGVEFKPEFRTKYCFLCLEQNIKKQKSNSTTRRMIRNREFIKNYKKDKRCEICGYNKYPRILDFHHRKKEEKNQGVCFLAKSLRNIDTIKKEIDKCMILCPNCHRELHLLERRHNKESGN